MERLQPVVRDRRANWRQSLSVLRAAKEVASRHGRRLVTKTSLMLGVGERPEEIEAALRELRANDVDVVTFGPLPRPLRTPLSPSLTRGRSHPPWASEAAGRCPAVPGSACKPNACAASLHAYCAQASTCARRRSTWPCPSM